MMEVFFPLLAGVALVALVYGVRHTAQVRATVTKHVAKTHVSQAVSALLIGAQLSELTKVLEHATFVHVIASVFILAMILAAKSGTEAELH